MDTDFRQVRRQNRVLNDEKRINELLTISEYCFINFGIAENGYAYGLPMSYTYDEDSNSLYFHCAPQGQKLDMMQTNNKVSVCVVGVTKPIAEEFTTLYESVIVYGRADLHLTDDEKRKALQLLVKKYSAGFEDKGEVYIDRSWSRTQCFRVKIEHVTAKAKYK